MNWYYERSIVIFKRRLGVLSPLEWLCILEQSSTEELRDVYKASWAPKLVCLNAIERDTFSEEHWGWNRIATSGPHRHEYMCTYIQSKDVPSKADTVAHTHNPSTQEAKADVFAVKTSLGYKMSSTLFLAVSYNLSQKPKQRENIFLHFLLGAVTGIKCWWAWVTHKILSNDIFVCFFVT